MWIYSNKQFSIENLKEKSLIALCRVADHMPASEETPKEVQRRNTKKTFANKDRTKKMKESH